MARLVVERGNEKGVSLNFDDFDCSKVIGRSSQCDLVLTSHMVSRRHFRVSRTDDLFTIEDLGSNNGTFVNGARIFEETLLLFGDRIRAGDTIFSFLSDMERNDGALAGQKIGGYHLLRRIGIGGMGEVYLATQMALSRTVALKILSPELTQDRAYVAKFVLEARSAGKLNHPNVVQVHEVGEENGVYFFSMEYVDGGSVQDLISRGRKLTPERIIDIAIQAAQALEYAEKQKIVHCDVKPDNLMLTKDGDVRLADLGIAKVMSSAGKAEQSEGVFGSPHYMAPEQTRGLPLDNRADLYSLGVTLYRCLSGKLPFSGNDAKEIMEKQVFEEPEPLKNLEPNLPPMLYTVVSKLMKKRPQDRYQSARDLITDLEKAREQIRQGIKASPRTSGTGPAVGRRVSRIRRRRPGWLGLLLVAAALAGGAALFSTLLAGTRDRADEARQVFAEAQEAEARSDFRTAEELYRKAVALAAKDNNRKDEAEYRKALEACRKRMADREAFEVARARFAGIRRAVERNEGNSLANLEAVRAFLAECRSDPSLDQLAREAAELERKCRERWNEESERECDATAETVRECLKRKDYDGAHLAIETFSRKYMGSTGWDGLEEGRRTLTDVLEKDMKAAVKASGEAMARGEYDRAVDVYSNFLERARLACEGRYRVEAERQIARLRAKIREARERGGGEKEKTDMAGASAAVERAREAMKALRLGRARAELDAALEIYRRYRRRDEEVRVEPLRADLKWLEALLAEITRRSDAGLPPIERITMPSGESLPVMAISPEGIRVRDADEKARIIPLESVTPDQLQRILEGCGLRGEGRLGAAALWFHRGLPALAEKELKEAKRENPRLRDDRDVAAFEERLRKGATED